MILPDYTTDKPIVKKKLLEMLPDLIEVFMNEPAVLRLGDEPIMLIGDIHGNYQALEIVLEQREVLGCKKILFLGDYVDRGSHGAEVLQKLFEMKLAEPDDVFLLRGNHEDIAMNYYYGFHAETGLDRSFMLSMQCIFESMPIAAVIDDEIFCVHGGINGDDNIDTITKTDSYQYLWNDPSDFQGLNDSDRGEDIKEFGVDIFDAFMKTNNLRALVRAHQFLTGGYRWWFKGRLLSLFSTMNYSGRKSSGAFAVYEDGGFALYVFNDGQKIDECV